ncbi:MAG: hypothetical protein JWQ40_2087 [Segetibacter sp.]|jgi:membrane associated rhomboid family serine protease|nr:hypothetical protein [Segetibacter sp.]
MTEFRPSSFPILPIVIKNLLIINVLFFLAQNTIAPTVVDFDDLLGLHHLKSPLFQPWQIVTHLFLHAGLGHIVSNMFALWMFGSVLENLWGPKRFLTFYFLCGIGAGLIQLAWLWFDYRNLLNDFYLLKMQQSPTQIIQFLQQYGKDFGEIFYRTGGPDILNFVKENPSDPVVINKSLEYITNLTSAKVNSPTIGASGAVFGILAAFVYLFPNTEIYLYFLFPIKAKWIGLAYFGYEIYSGIVNNTGDNIAHWAHIGGGLVGFLLVLTWNKRNRQTFY